MCSVCLSEAGLDASASGSSALSAAAIDTASDFCASKSGCDINMPSPPANTNQSWAAFLDAAAFGLGNWSYSPGHSNSLLKERRDIVAALDNVTAADLAAPPAETWVDDPASAVVLLMSPGSLNLADERESALTVYFYGVGLRRSAPWCMHVDSRPPVECRFDEKFIDASVHCLLPFGLTPGTASVELLHACSTTIFNSTLTLTFNRAAVQTGTGGQSSGVSSLKSDFLDVSVWQEQLSVVSLRPLSGGVNGGTAVSILGGSGLVSTVKSCTFRFNNGVEYSVPASPATTVASEGGVVCTTPEVEKTDSATVLLNLRRGPQFPTGYTFTFHQEPVVTFVSTALSKSEDYVTVSGHHFPIFTQSFCNISFSDGQSTLAAARTVSSTQMVCLGATKAALSDRVVRSVTVSFNGVDFLHAEGANILSTVTPQRNVSFSASEEQSFTYSEFGASDSAAYRLAALGVNARVIQLTCDGPNTVAIQVPSVTQTSRLSCLLDGEAIGSVRFGYVLVRNAG